MSSLKQHPSAQRVAIPFGLFAGWRKHKPKHQVVERSAPTQARWATRAGRPVQRKTYPRGELLALSRVSRARLPTLECICGARWGCPEVVFLYIRWNRDGRHSGVRAQARGAVELTAFYAQSLCSDTDVRNSEPHSMYYSRWRERLLSTNDASVHTRQGGAGKRTAWYGQRTLV